MDSEVIGKSKICRLYMKVSRDFGQSELRDGTSRGPFTCVQRSLYLFGQFNIHRTYLNSSQKVK